MNEQQYQLVLKAAKTKQAEGFKITNDWGIVLSTTQHWIVSGNHKNVCPLSCLLLDTKDKLGCGANEAAAAILRADFIDICHFVDGFDCYDGKVPFNVDKNNPWFRAGNRMRKELGIE